MVVTRLSSEIFIGSIAMHRSGVGMETEIWQSTQLNKQKLVLLGIVEFELQ